MTTPAQPAPSARTSVHRRALTLAAILFGIFVAVAGLNARYGYRFVLKVFEEQQIGNAADTTGPAKLVNYEDYLRVDAENARMKQLMEGSAPHN